MVKKREEPGFWAIHGQSAIGAVGVVVAIIGAYLLWVQIDTTRKDAAKLERKQLTIELFLRKYDDRLLAAYSKVSNAFDSRNRELTLFSGHQVEGQEAVTADITADAGLDNIKMIVDYYNDLLVCIDEGLCDGGVARSLTGRDIHNFYCKARFVGLPQLQEKFSDAEYGARLEKYAGKCD